MNLLNLVLYNLAILIYSPRWLKKRKSQWSGRDGKHAERFGRGRWTCPLYLGNTELPNYPESGRKHVIFLGFGYGQIRQIDQLTQLFQKTNSNVDVTWAFAKPDAVEKIRLAYPHQKVTLIPFDFFLPTRRWWKKMKPDVLVAVERAWYPNLSWYAGLKCAKFVLVNGARQTGDAIFKMLPRFMQLSMASNFSSMLFQNQEYQQEMECFLCDRIPLRFAGNLKFDIRPADKPNVQQELAAWLETSNRIPILAAGSTGEIDEEFVFRAFHLVKARTECKLMIAPRQLPRVEELKIRIVEQGWKLSQRTQPVSKADVFILDTMGELAISYQFCAGVFIGGTIGGAGHDIVEPLIWGVPVYFGTGKNKAGAGQREAENAGVGFRVTTPEELSEYWLKLVRDENLRAELASKAKELLEEQSGSMARNVAAITELL